MLKFTKNGGVKFISPKSDLIPILVKDGWVADGNGNKKLVDAIVDVSDDTLRTLKAQADEMGLEYHPNIGAAKLAAKIEEAKNNG